jgi:hypothetical protein
MDSDTTTTIMDAILSVPTFTVVLLLWLGMAVGNGFIARRLGHSVVLWVVLSLVPVVNYFFYIYVGYAVILGILKRLDALQARLYPPTT